LQCSFNFQICTSTDYQIKVDTFAKNLKMTISSLQEATQVFEKFQDMNILIIGDVMIDSYLFGNVNRISPEAPVPIVAVNKRTNRLGGAANVALNIKAMGARPVLCSVIGQDEKAESFENLLSENGMFNGGILRSRKRITTTKFRVIGNNTQMLRVDEEDTSGLDAEDFNAFRHLIGTMLEEQTINAIIFQDYDKGVISPKLIDEVTKLASGMGIPVTVDPKRKNFSSYRNLTMFKPNLKELQEGLGMDFLKTDKAKLSEAVRAIHQSHNVELVLVTLSEQGVLISRRLNDEHYAEHLIPAHLRSIADVSGAGDTVISVATLCLAAGLPDIEIAALSNLAGGQVCEYVGVVPVDREKLLKETSKLTF
jgi:rfaE bifunctional protein kinase chain/domain